MTTLARLITASALMTATLGATIQSALAACPREGITDVIYRDKCKLTFICINLGSKNNPNRVWEMYDRFPIGCDPDSSKRPALDHKHPDDVIKDVDFNPHEACTLGGQIKYVNKVGKCLWLYTCEMKKHGDRVGHWQLANKDTC